MEPERKKREDVKAGKREGRGCDGRVIFFFKQKTAYEIHQ